jgi:2-amino-4-hydroxy-6-hydroxymethyldihydropteridine diphosphokinase
MALVYLLLGSNIGNKKKFIETAENEVLKRIGIIEKQSSLFKTQAWGNTELPEFINKLIIINTEKSPFEILEIIHKIENNLGRKREINQYNSRTIDIDILFYNNFIINTNNLTVPHPLLHERKFVLATLLEVCPNFIHPVLLKSMTDLYNLCKDNLKVEIINY